MTEARVCLQGDAVGVEAARFLRRRDPVAGRTVAVFDRALYVAFADQMLCVTHRSVDLGPISVRTSALSCWPEYGVRSEQSITLTPQGLDVAGKFIVSLTFARELKPAAPRFRTVQGKRPLRNLDLSRLAKASDGLLPAIYSDSPSEGHRLIRFARPLIAQARSWLRADGVYPEAGWAERLVGLGPGLTPSGDDVIAGMMIALHHTGQRAQANALWQRIEPVLAERTNAISAALLRAAAKGNGSLALHAALESLIYGNSGSEALRRLARQGHSSGTDALAGILLVLEAEQMRMELAG